MAINHDAFATGFEERTSTFSHEKRALNPVRIVVMGVCVQSYARTFRDFSCLKEIYCCDVMRYINRYYSKVALPSSFALMCATYK